MISETNHPPALRGPRVVLRGPEARDIADRLAAGRDPEFRRMVGAVGPASKSFGERDAERWYQELVGEPFAWVIEHEGRCIGLARIHDLDPNSRAASMALGLFSATDRGRGFGTEVIRLILAYAFHDLGLAMLQVRVLSFNARAIRCYERCGFAEISREPVMLGDERATDILMQLKATAFHASLPLHPSKAG